MPAGPVAGILGALAFASMVLAGESARAQAGGGESLHAYAAAGNVGSMARALNAGSDIDARDAQGQTALHAAAAEGQLLSAMMLVAKGAELDARDRRGRTPLHVAASGDAGTEGARFQIIQLLLSEGANPKRKDADGKLPIDYATRREIVAALRP